MSETPALVGGKRGHLQCRQDIDSMAYWNDPQGTRDQEFVSPFRVEVRNTGLFRLSALLCILLCFLPDEFTDFTFLLFLEGR